MMDPKKLRLEASGFNVAGMFPVNMDGVSVVEYDCLIVRLKAHYGDGCLSKSRLFPADVSKL
jgi:hypothetical protein